MDTLGDDIEVGSPGAFGEPPIAPQRGLAVVATVIFFGSMLGRVLGLVREQLAASHFGAGDQIAAFTVADNLNTLVFDLISSGMLEAALIPVLAALVVASPMGRERLRRLTGVLLSVSVSMAALFAAIGVIFAPALVRLMTAIGERGQARNEAATELAVQNLRIVLPSLVFLVAGTVMIAALYAVQRPAAPSLGGAARNLSAVVCILVLGSRYGTKAMAIGVLIGAIAVGGHAMEQPAPGGLAAPPRIRSIDARAWRDRTAVPARLSGSHGVGGGRDRRPQSCLAGGDRRGRRNALRHHIGATHLGIGCRGRFAGGSAAALVSPCKR